MKGKRKIFDAVDLLTEDSSAQVPEGGVRTLPLDSIRAFHDHPFRLYEGERLKDMVESIREHGVLSPVIVQETQDGYEMLSGHNRQNAARLAGLEAIPAIVKSGLSEEDAYVYVIETNLMQRSFSDLLPSEKAAVLAERYDKIKCQGKRNDILREIAILNGKDVPDTSGHGVHKSRDDVGEEYGLTGRSIARYMRINQLMEPMKQMLDVGELTFRAAVELSYLNEAEQGTILEQMQWGGAKVGEAEAKALRSEAGALDDAKVEAILHPVREKAVHDTVSVRLPAGADRKYFAGMKAREKSEIIVKALEAWFERAQDSEDNL
jgi:ParB family chromosome partitioning protein